MKVRLIAFVLLFIASVHATAQDRFLFRLTLPTGETVVVAEGDFEARSIGSFSVRLYEAAPAPDQTTFFISGLIHARDGTVEKVLLADINEDQQEDIVVTVRSVGSGNYLSAHAFTIVNGDLVFVDAVDGLAANADPVAALLNAAK